VAGSIAIHIMSVEFVGRLATDPEFAPPVTHRAEKKIPHVDLKTGEGDRSVGGSTAVKGWSGFVV